MRFNAPKCDSEIMERMREKTKICDLEPVQQSNWPIRMPDKDKNLGRAQIRFKDRTALQKIHAKLQKDY